MNVAWACGSTTSPLSMFAMLDLLETYCMLESSMYINV
jgi:hypothetical protein